MTIRRDTLVKAQGSLSGKGKSHKDLVVKLITSDENQRPRLGGGCDSGELEKGIFF